MAEPVLLRHADHDPEIVCRPAGNGLCESMDEERAARLRRFLDEMVPGWRERAVAHLPPLEP